MDLITATLLRVLAPALGAMALALPAALGAQAPPRFWPQERGPPDTLRIVAVGDINFGRVVAREYLLAGRAREIFAGVRDVLRAADLAIGNLESQVLDRGDYADPAGSWVFAGPAEAAELLADAGFDVVGTANNHSWDFGRAGLLESLAHLRRAGVLQAGTGPDAEAAYAPALLARRGRRIAVFAVTAIFNHPSLTLIGQPAECCVAWADTLRLARAFRAARDSAGADLILVSLHHGFEYRGLPTREAVALARGMIRAGADAVFGHHPHVPQGIEWLDGKLIIYSLGNFVFRQYRPWTERGLWAELLVLPDGALRLRLRPVAAGVAPRLLTGADSAATLRHVAQLSEQLARLRPRGPARNVGPP